MVDITTKLLYIDLELKNKIEFVCSFCNTTPTIIEGSIRNINLTFNPTFIATFNPTWYN